MSEPGDLVLDPFGGSNTTGFCAEKLQRKWISIEIQESYGVQSAIRFEENNIESNLVKTEYFNQIEKRNR